jgi:hypothetical protein
MLSDNSRCVLAETPRFGSVFDCGSCGNIHVTMGPVSFVLTPDEYMKLVTMIHTSASRFEAWLEQKHRPFEWGNEHFQARPDVDPL